MYSEKDNCSHSSSNAVSVEQPNIVVILADDLGYGSAGCYGAEPDLIRTPHIDRLASQGMRFTDVSTPASICSPTRYGLLTGRYHWREKVHEYGVLGVHSELGIDTERETIASWLKKKGYTNAAIGKWHLGYGEGRTDYTKLLKPGPLDIGFDYHFGVPVNHGHIVGAYVENDRIYGLRSDKQVPYSRSFYGERYLGLDAPQRENKQVMHDLTEKSVDWIRSMKQNEPFFLYFAPVAVHHPSTPSDDMRGASEAGPYGDFIQDLDKSVGRIMETLDYLGLTENTIFIFTSDNGGEIPKDETTPERYAMRQGLRINGEFRGDKHLIWQGGVKVPLIVRWPGHVEPGSTHDAMISTNDIFPTVADIVGGPTDVQDSVPPDSHSFLPALRGEAEGTTREDLVITDLYGQFAYRREQWRYIDDRIPESLPEPKKEELQRESKKQLFDVENDPSETENVIEEHPEVAERMEAELKTVRERNN